MYHSVSFTGVKRSCVLIWEFNKIPVCQRIWYRQKLNYWIWSCLLANKLLNWSKWSTTNTFPMLVWSQLKFCRSLSDVQKKSGPEFFSCLYFIETFSAKSLHLLLSLEWKDLFPVLISLSWNGWEVTFSLNDFSPQNQTLFCSVRKMRDFQYPQWSLDPF